jgi:hypothetical protein
MVTGRRSGPAGLIGRLEARDVRLDASTLEDAFVRLTGTHPHREGEQP